MLSWEGRGSKWNRVQREFTQFCLKHLTKRTVFGNPFHSLSSTRELSERKYKLKRKYTHHTEKKKNGLKKQK